MKFLIALIFCISLAEAATDKIKWSGIISKSNGVSIRLPTIEEAKRDLQS